MRDSLSTLTRFCRQARFQASFPRTKSMQSLGTCAQWPRRKLERALWTRQITCGNTSCSVLVQTFTLFSACPLSESCCRLALASSQVLSTVQQWTGSFHGLSRGSGMLPSLSSRNLTWYAKRGRARVSEFRVHVSVYAYSSLLSPCRFSLFVHPCGLLSFMRESREYSKKLAARMCNNI